MPVAILKKNLSQVGYPGAGDIDDCWIVATLTCVHNLVPLLKLPTVPEFRAAAGKPDVQGRSDGGTRTDIVRGLRNLYPKIPMTSSYVRWHVFKGLMKPGRVASIAVASAYLPSALRYGFNGAHQIAVEQISDGRWVILNPLAKKGTAPQAISESTLMEAALRIGGGYVLYVLFSTSLREYFALNVFVRSDTPGTFVIPAGKVVNGYRWGSGGWSRVKTWSARSTPSSGSFDYVLRRSSGSAVPSVVLHVTGGYFDGLFISSASVDEKIAPPPLAYTKAQLDAAVAAAKTEVKTAVTKAIAAL